MKINKTLRALTALAMTLPGISKGIAASEPILKPKSDLNYTFWDEGKDHYKIDLYHLNLGVPIKEGVSDFSLNFIRDVMTGPSSYFPVPGFLVTGAPPNELVELITGPSKITDTRSEVNATGRYFFKENNFNAHSTGLQLGYSTENDYRAYFVNFTPEFTFNKKNTVLGLGFGVSRDTLNPTDTRYRLVLPNKVPLHIGHKTTQKYVVSLRQDLSPKSYIQQNISFVYDKGLMNDPYKRVAIFGDVRGTRPGSLFLPQFNTSADYDRRPKTRSTWTFATRYVQYIEPLDSSVHFDYRYGTNSWSINSHTFKLAYHQPFEGGWEVAPSLRYYSQGRAKFYGAAFRVEPGAPFPTKPLDPTAPASTDYRLAGYGSVGAELQVSKVFLQDYKGTFIVGRSRRDGRWNLGKSDEIKRTYNNFNTTYAGVQLSVVAPSDLGVTDKLAGATTVDQEDITAGYKQGQFTITPLTVVFSSPTFGYKRNDSKISDPGEKGARNNDFAVDAFRNRKAFGFNHPSRNGLGYSLKMGYLVFDNLELFVTPFLSYERGDEHQANFQSLKFAGRSNYGALVGAMKYFDLNKRWIPHVSAAIGVERQDRTQATFFNNTGFEFPIRKIGELGQFTFRDKTNYFLLKLGAGADYKLTPNIIMEFNIGLDYRKRKSTRQVTVPGAILRVNQFFQPITGDLPVRYKDNHNEWTVPITVGLKFAL